jgi:Fibronectin type III domain
VKPKPRAIRIPHNARLSFRISHSAVHDVGLRNLWLRARRLALPFSLICIALISSSCGKVGAPVAPVRLTERTAELSAIQRGSNVLLQWPAPSLGQKESSRSYISRVDIYRLDEQRDEEPVLDSDDYEEEARLIGYLDRAKIEAQLKSVGHLEFTDAINLSNASELSNTRLRYAVRYLNARQQAAAFSNTVAIEPAPSIALPPTGLRVEAPTQDVVAISWSAPDVNVDGTRPAAIVGYNVYRRNANKETGGRQLNTEPVTDSNFTDKDFQYKTEYTYFVRALSQGANGLIESADSELATLTPVDEFAPLAPDPVSIASANGTISLFWPTSPERDVVGYNVYRSDSADTAEKDWIKLTAQPITAVTYRDERVVIDNLYFYRVTAVDKFNNESKPSRTVSETVHP